MAGDEGPPALRGGLSAAASRDRLWLGERLAQDLAEARVVVVGAGGTGWLLALEAAAVGVGSLTLCDGDVLEASNVNRLLGALPADTGRPKVDVLAEFLRSRYAGCCVEAIAQPAPNDALDAALSPATAVFGCVDNTQARLELDVVCRARGRLLVDVGVGFAFDERGAFLRAGGQVLVSQPNGACLQCLGFRPAAPQHDYFVPGRDDPVPSSLLLNAVLASLAVERWIAERRHSITENRIDYDATGPRIELATVVAARDCPVCGIGSQLRLARVGHGWTED
jgi:molybdopterin/thiamine biosynthesis adenylyltransferase